MGTEEDKIKKSPEEELDSSIISEIFSTEEEQASRILSEIPGVGPTIVEKLIEGGFSDLESIAVADPKYLAAHTDMGEATCHKIILGAMEKLKIGFLTGDALDEVQKNRVRITTGSDNLDSILGGGIETGVITEAFGEFRTGKTQLAHQLSVTAQLPLKQLGYEKSVLFIDNEGTFWVDRLRPIIERYGLDEAEVLKRIMYIRTYSSNHQILALETASKFFKERDIGTIIVDGLMSHLRHEYSGRGMIAERQAKLGKILKSLERYAEAYKLAVYITNQVHTDSGVFFGDPTKPIGGHVIAHCSQFRLYLRKTKGNKRVARLVKCSHLPEGEALFEITDNGIQDV